jgi:cytochrome c-type biogenesis protein CcmH
LALAIALALAGPALAVEPDEVLDDPVLEQRARDLSGQVRCVVCASEAIDSSQATIARDLRILIRERLVEGDTDAEVLDYLVARYGDYVLFRPPWGPSTYALWLGPFALLGAGAVGIALTMRRRPVEAPAPLSPEEEAELAELRRGR